MGQTKMKTISPGINEIDEMVDILTMKTKAIKRLAATYAEYGYVGEKDTHPMREYLVDLEAETVNIRNKIANIIEKQCS